MHDAVTTELAYPESDFLLVIKAKDAEMAASTWAASNRQFLKESIVRYGAVLLRGFACDRFGFSEVARTLEPEGIDYRGGIGPRRIMAPEVYNSTDLPPKHSLPQHHEMAYNSYWPMQLLFFCEVPPEHEGATTICDARRFYHQLDPALVQEFTKRGVKYVRNFTKDMPYRSIEETFGTTDKQWIVEFCAKNDVVATWKSDDWLELTQTAPAVRKHPETGAPIFFNTLALWHYAHWSHLVESFGQKRGDMSPDKLWMNSLYGDGSPIEDEVVHKILDTYEDKQLEISWQKSDIIYFDNMLVSHGRQKFAGKRSILASFRTPCYANTLASPAKAQNQGAA